jgi:hypothetical protein
MGPFILYPQHWVVEQTIAWLNGARHLSKVFEQKCLYPKNIIRIPAIA